MELSGTYRLDRGFGVLSPAINWMVLAVLLSCCGVAKAAGIRGGALIAPNELRLDSQINPVGLEDQKPRFSWTLSARSSTARGLTQSGYRIVVGTSPQLPSDDEEGMWDSGRVASSRLFGVEYAGKPMLPSTRYYWKVQVWDGVGRASAWSNAAIWTTGLRAEDWSAQWIAAEADGSKAEVGRALPIFRHQFKVDRAVRQAIVYVSGLGQYELRLNGKDVTGTVLNPAWTHYRKTIAYNSYDVTAALRRGKNAFGVLLGNGMYNVEETKGRYTKFTGTFGQPKLILQMVVRYRDGSEAVVASDGSWKTAEGPIVFSSTYGGEDYDARREQAGWDAAEFDDSRWKAVQVVSGPGGVLRAQAAPPIALERILKPVKVTEPEPGVQVYDLGQNFAGWPRIRVSGAAGGTLRLTAGELLDDKGLVTQRSADARPGSANLFSYTLKGSGEETWHPRFSYYGFRYVQVERTGSARVLALDGELLHDAVSVDGQFTSSSDLFNRVHRLIDAAIVSNMYSVLSDCPTREKLGWLEQTHLAGTSILYNYGGERLYEKIAADMRDAQLQDGLIPSIAPEYVAFTDNDGRSNAFRDSPEWGSAVILSPWVAYQFYGDLQVLAANYGAMRAYAAYLRGKAKNHMLAYGLGDWYDIGPKFPGESQLTGKGLTATAIYYQDLTTLNRIATLLGKADDATGYAAEADLVKAAFNRNLFHAESDQYDRGSQTAQAMPLVLGLVPEERRQAVLDALVADIRRHEYHVTAGDVGFHYVVRALTDGGRSDVLYEMLSRRDSPSYGYQLSRGATTLTEAWDTNPASSQNHFMLGHGEEWFYRGLAGIDFDLSRPVERQITIQPAIVGDVTSASATYRSILGPIRSAWRREGHTIHLAVSIPPGAQATVSISVGRDNRSLGPLAGGITESGHRLPGLHGVSAVTLSATTADCLIGSGEYRFEWQQ